jgi:hypothetical protein
MGKSKKENLYKKGLATQSNPNCAPNKCLPKKTIFKRTKSSGKKNLPKLKYVPEGGKKVTKPVNKFKYNKGTMML